MRSAWYRGEMRLFNSSSFSASPTLSSSIFFIGALHTARGVPLTMLSNPDTPLNSLFDKQLGAERGNIQAGQGGGQMLGCLLRGRISNTLKVQAARVSCSPHPLIRYKLLYLKLRNEVKKRTPVP